MKNKMLKNMSRLSTAVVALTVCAALVVLAACGAGITATPSITTTPLDGGGTSAKTAESYQEIYDALSEMNAGRGYKYLTDVAEDGAVVFTQESAAAAEEPAAPAPAPEEEAVTGSAGADLKADYSETNTQVKGVDEADTIKTDGEYIYHLTNNSMYISSAEGADSALLSQTGVFSDNENAYPQEFYIMGDRLVILGSEYVVWEAAYVDDSAADAVRWNDDSLTVSEIYDISDPYAPALISTLSQSGSYVSSRMMNGHVYVVSSKYIYNYPDSPDVPERYVPCTYIDGEGAALEPSEVVMFDDPSGSSYTVITSIDPESGTEHDSQKAVFGAAGTIYMNESYLIVASSDSVNTFSEPQKDAEGKTFQTREWTSQTKLALFSIDAGSVTEVASGAVPGSLVNQFAMDERNGYVRVVTTVNYSKETIFTDGIDKYEYEDSMSNGLYILDTSMNIVGMIEDVAPDERVYSVRFDGDVCYFVTFRQVDPLFSVDVSDPTNPVITGELKLPGYSSYLHLWSGTHLLGLGFDADEETGEVNSMKLSMFDVQDYANMTELVSEILPYSWSPATYDHRQLLVSQERNIIGFWADEVFAIYGYDDENGFYLRAELRGDGAKYIAQRALYIDQALYLLGESGIGIYDMELFEEIGGIDY